MKTEKSDFKFLIGAMCIALALVVTTNCTTKQKATETVIPVPTPVASVEPSPSASPELPFAGVSFKAAWDGVSRVPSYYTPMMVDVILKDGAELLETKVSDASRYCKNYNTMDRESRMQFYVGLFSKMTQYESNFKPETTYKENFKDAKGNYVISRGLFQLSVESANQSAYKCNVTEKSLHDARANMSCAVKIAKYWIVKDGKIGTDKKGIGRYWSVGRETSGSNAKITAYTKTLPGCK